MRKVILFISFLLLLSCKDNDSKIEGDGYNRSALLNSVVENNILPAYNDFDAKLNTLDTGVDAFVTTPNETNLAAIKTAYVAAYKVWQYVEKYNVLLAVESEYRQDFNTYPVDVTEIESFIDGTFGQAISEINFTGTSKNDAQGFPAIDYLINNGDAATVVARFTGSKSAEYKELLSLYSNRMVTLTNAVIADWNTRKAEFIADNSNSLTSSFNLFINDYIFYTEKGFREAKVVFPAGLRDKTISKTTRVESFYSPENSKILFLEAFKGLKNIFIGTPYTTQNVTPIGIKDYLNAVNAEVMVDGKDVALANYIENTLFTNIQTAINGVDANFVTQIETNAIGMQPVFDAVQTMVVAIKVNALESFKVDVDYVDSDGD